MKNIEERMLKKRKTKEYRTYHFKDYSTSRIIFYPLLILYWGYDGIKDVILFFIKWSNKRADRIITECIVRNGELKNENIYYDWRTWDTWWYDYHCRLRDLAFCRKYNNSLTLYFVNEYQLEGYTKEVEFDDGWYNFTFTKNN